MKIYTKTGNLLDVKRGHIVHGCNARGVMGSGVALAVKNTYPQAYEAYRDEFESRELVLGVAYAVPISPDLILWNAITQEGFGQPTRNCSYDAIQTCFETIDRVARTRKDIEEEIHIPMIGAGLGGGNWNIIREIIEQTCVVPVTLWVLP